MSNGTIAAVVLTYNNERTIARLLASLDFAAEIIVVDSGSIDNTPGVVRSFPRTRLYHRTLDSFAGQRNFGAAQATSDWILHGDSDELVPAELARELVDVAAEARQGIPQAYNVVEQFFWCGHRIRYCDGPWGGRVKFHRRDLARMVGAIHEVAETNGVIGMLRAPIFHMSEGTLNEQVLKYLDYSDREAAAFTERSRTPPSSALSIFWRPARKLLGALFRRGAYRDGVPGLSWAVLQSLAVFLASLKYWDARMNQGQRLTRATAGEE